MRNIALINLVATVAVTLFTTSDSAFPQDQSAAKPEDAIYARKILMNSADNNLDQIDWMLSSDKPVDMARASEYADTISVMLQTLPHLFPPATNQWKAGVQRNPARDTFASPDIWTNFRDFYQRAADASKLAHNISLLRKQDELDAGIDSLREACEGCHAVYVKSE